MVITKKNDLAWQSSKFNFEKFSIAASHKLAPSIDWLQASSSIKYLQLQRLSNIKHTDSDISKILSKDSKDKVYRCIIDAEGH